MKADKTKLKVNQSREETEKARERNWTTVLGVGFLLHVYTLGTISNPTPTYYLLIWSFVNRFRSNLECK